MKVNFYLERFNKITWNHPLTSSFLKCIVQKIKDFNQYTAIALISSYLLVSVLICCTFMQIIYKTY